MGVHKGRPSGVLPRVLAASAVVLALGAGAQLTSALWSDQVAATSDVTSGTVDLSVNGGASYAIPASTLANLKPGDSKSFNLTIANTGTLPGTLALTVGNGGTASALPAALTFTIADGATVIHNGTLAVGSKALSPTPLMAASASKTYTVTVTLPASAPSNLQGQSFTTSLDFTLTPS